MTRPVKSILLRHLAPSIGDLRALAILLNSPVKGAMHKELLRLVEAWRASGPNVRKLLHREPELSRRILNGTTVLQVTNAPMAQLAWFPFKVKIPHTKSEAQKPPLSPEDEARYRFTYLLVNPEWERFAGPCDRCGRFYVKKTLRHQYYCSRSCSSAATAIAATASKREQERNDKLGRAQDAIHAWERSSSTQDWRKLDLKKTGFTPNWLTRVVNNGSVVVPDS
jgi:hypothetical protein